MAGVLTDAMRALPARRLLAEATERRRQEAEQAAREQALEMAQIEAENRAAAAAAAAKAAADKAKLEAAKVGAGRSHAHAWCIQCAAMNTVWCMCVRFAAEQCLQPADKFTADGVCASGPLHQLSGGSGQRKLTVGDPAGMLQRQGHSPAAADPAMIAFPCSLAAPSPD
jgi:hypothetical protein